MSLAHKSIGCTAAMVSFLCFLLLSGCGDGKPSIDSSLTEATVTGLVSVKGKPATAGTIRFNPSNSGRIVPFRSADIGSDGTYSIKTYTGMNRVSFEGPVASQNKGVGLLKQYADVKSGENKIDFDLMGEGTKVGDIDIGKLSPTKKKR
jgi:hypothetical protein